VLGGKQSSKTHLFKSYDQVLKVGERMVHIPIDPYNTPALMIFESSHFTIKMSKFKIPFTSANPYNQLITVGL